MQPGVTVALATVWLAFGVVGTSASHHHPHQHLALDQYSPLPASHHGIYQRADGEASWKDRHLAGRPNSDLIAVLRKSNFIDVNDAPIVGIERDWHSGRASYSSEMVKEEDPEVEDYDSSAGESYQDQGPGSVEIYKLDLFDDKTLMMPVAPKVVLEKTRPSVDTKITETINSLEAAGAGPKIDNFAVGGVPELQVGCEGLESSVKVKRSTDVKDDEPSDETLLGVTPITLDLDYELSLDNAEEEMDELFKLKKFESTTKKSVKRGDIDATVFDDGASRGPEKLPVRGDLGKVSKRSRRSAVWGFGEDEGVVTSDELQTDERRRNHPEDQQRTSNGRDEYERYLRERQEDEERRRREQEYEERKRAQDRMEAERRLRDKLQGRTNSVYTEEDRRNMVERQRQWDLKRQQQNQDARTNEDRRRQQESQDRRAMEDRQRQQQSQDARAMEDRRRQYELQRQQQERNERTRRPNEPANLTRNENERLDREREEKLRDYIERNRPIRVGRPDSARREEEERKRRIEQERREEDERRRRIDQERRIEEARRAKKEQEQREEEERKRRMEEERRYRLPDDNQQTNDENTSERRLEELRRREYEERRMQEYVRRSQQTKGKNGSKSDSYENRRNIDDSRPYDSDSSSFDNARQHGPYSPTNVNPYSSNEARRREEEARRLKSRWYEEERQRQLAVRGEEEKQRQLAARGEEERQRQLAARAEEERRRQQSNVQRPDQAPANLLSDRDRKESWKRREEARLNALPVQATVVIRGRKNGNTWPNLGPRNNFNNEIGFPGANPDRQGHEVPRFPMPATSRPPAKSPGPCIWAIVQCCPSSNNRLTTCFESMGCPGASWDPNPCHGRVAQAARSELMKFYAESDDDPRYRI